MKRTMTPWWVHVTRVHRGALTQAGTRQAPHKRRPLYLAVQEGRISRWAHTLFMEVGRRGFQV